MNTGRGWFTELAVIGPWLFSARRLDRGAGVAGALLGLFDAPALDRAAGLVSPAGREAARRAGRPGPRRGSPKPGRAAGPALILGNHDVDDFPKTPQPGRDSLLWSAPRRAKVGSAPRRGERRTNKAAMPRSDVVGFVSRFLIVSSRSSNDDFHREAALTPTGEVDGLTADGGIALVTVGCRCSTQRPTAAPHGGSVAQDLGRRSGRRQGASRDVAPASTSGCTGRFGTDFAAKPPRPSSRFSARIRMNAGPATCSTASPRIRW